MKRIAGLLLVSCIASFAVSGADAPHRYNPFGTPGETSPEMLAALNRMSEACVVEGRRGSPGHFRWSGTPPKLSHLGLWGAKVGNDEAGQADHGSLLTTGDSLQAVPRKPEARLPPMSW